MPLNRDRGVLFDVLVDRIVRRPRAFVSRRTLWLGALTVLLALLANIAPAAAPGQADQDRRGQLLQRRARAAPEHHTW